MKLFVQTFSDKYWLYIVVRRGRRVSKGKTKWASDDDQLAVMLSSVENSTGGGTPSHCAVKSLGARSWQSRDRDANLLWGPEYVTYFFEWFFKGLTFTP